MFLRSVLALGLSSVALVACGGTSIDRGSSPQVEQDGGAGAGGSGPNAQAGAAGMMQWVQGGASGSGTGGAWPIGAGGAVQCCDSPLCGPDEKEVAPSSCPAGALCHQVQGGPTPQNPSCLSCSTIWCASFPAQCTAAPVCDAGDVQTNGTCPPGVACYGRTVCGTSITCIRNLAYPDAGFVDSGALCNPQTELGLHYVSTSPSQCQVLDFACPPYTTGFANGCGCGCAQDPSCPSYIGCMPAPGPQDPLCADTSKCPYSIRAL